MQPRIYTYKITFEEVPYYYYGSKKEKYYSQEYWGSPVTNKWCWELYTPKKQILEFFDYTDEGYEECRKVEDRLIKPVLNDPWCLNESCGLLYSLEIARKSAKLGGEKVKELRIGIFSLNKEEKIKVAKKGAQKVKELGVGIFAMSKEEKVKIAKENEKNKIGIFALTPEQRSNNSKISGKISGRVCFEKKIGIFGMSENDKKEAERRGGIITSSKLNKQKWMCLETGYVTTPGPLTRYQKTNGIDTSKRIRLE
jgi:hypothetical protein